jgi:hypothetical protein
MSRWPKRRMPYSGGETGAGQSSGSWQSLYNRSRVRDHLATCPRTLPIPQTAYQFWRHFCPYGIWECDSGEQIIFAENYLPIARRRPNQPAEFVDQFYWVKWREQNYFHDLEEYPHNWRKTMRRINKTLMSWGLPPYPERPRRHRGYIKPREWAGRSMPRRPCTGPPQPQAKMSSKP